MNPVYDQLIANYHDWLKGRMTVAIIDGVCEITTPFLDRHNDRLQIYVEQRDGGFRLSDDSYIIGDLEASGCTLDTTYRQKLLKLITGGFGVDVVGDELVVEATEKEASSRSGNARSQRHVPHRKGSGRQSLCRGR